jgi:peptidoglycan-associated lipoprotein
MNRPSLTKTATLLLLVCAFGSFGCAKRVAAALPLAPPRPAAPAPPAPGITLSADRTTITVGQPVTLTWQSANATAVTINPAVGAVPANGNRQVSPAATTTYTAAATGPGGNAQSAGLVITVNRASAPPAATATPPPPVRVTGPTPDQLFAQAMTPILFDYDKANIRADQETRLRTIASWLKQTPGESFTIEGHADERGGQEYNVALGDERAAVTKKFLAAQGIVESRMQTVSFGEERPACRAQTEECWQMNRRAAFHRTR